MNAPNASEPLIYVNGEFAPEKQARVPVMDRSFLYGDGLFETIRVTKGHCFLWDAHMGRLDLGARFLQIAERPSLKEIEVCAMSLLAENKLLDGFVRIHLSRGVGPRGYSIRGLNIPNLVISTHPASADAPARLKLITSQIRIMADEPWTQFKTANRLPSILAKREADEAETDDALILNHRWTIAGSSAGNVFCIRGDSLVTPPLAAGALAGTTRAFVMATAKKMGMEAHEEEMTLEAFHGSDAAFLTSAGLLVTAVESLDSKPMNPDHPHIQKLREHCERGAEVE